MLVTKIDNVREKRQTRCENEDFREELEYLADENDTLNRIAMREDRVVVDCKKDTLVKTKKRPTCYGGRCNQIAADVRKEHWMRRMWLCRCLCLHESRG